VLLRMVE